MTVDVLCALGTNGKPYAEYLRKSMLALSTTTADFRWKCILGMDRNDKYDAPEGWECIGRGSNKVDHASVNHTANMHELLKHASGDFTIIADIDVAILRKGWDQCMFDNLEKYDCFGIAWGAWDRKYLDFPCIMFIAFRTPLLKELNWDLSPVTKKGNEGISRYVATKKDAEICRVAVGTLLKQDSGWKIPYFFHEKGKTGLAAKKLKVGGKRAQLPFANKKQQALCLSKPTHMSEYILDGELFATHLQACRSKPWDGDHTKAWRWRIERYVQDKHGIRL